MSDSQLLVTADLVDPSDIIMPVPPHPHPHAYGLSPKIDRAHTGSPLGQLAGTGTVYAGQDTPSAHHPTGVGAIGQPTPGGTPAHSRTTSSYSGQLYHPNMGGIMLGAAQAQQGAYGHHQPQSQLRKSVLDDLDSSLAHLTVHPHQHPILSAIDATGGHGSQTGSGDGHGVGAGGPISPGLTMDTQGGQGEHDKSRWSDAGAIGQGVQHGYFSTAQGQPHHAYASPHHRPHATMSQLPSEWTTSNQYTSGQPNLYQAFHHPGPGTTPGITGNATSAHSGMRDIDNNSKTSISASSNNGNDGSTDNRLTVEPSAGAIAPPAPRSAPLYASYPTATQPSINASNTHIPSLGNPAASTNSTTYTAALTSQALTHLSHLHTLLLPLSERADELQDAQKEIEMWRAAWGASEREKRVLEGRLEGVKKGVPAGPTFTAVLIDGDGLIFTDDLLRAGFQGGQRAAKSLLSSLPSMLNHASISPTSSTFGTDLTLPSTESASGGLGADGLPSKERQAGQSGTGNNETDGREAGGKREIGAGGAVVNVFFNKAGLGSALVKAGIIQSFSLFESFIQGFSQAHELFTVVDVGPGKEATDAKIREHLRFYARNAQCEMIVLGASHDNGYANILSSLSTENRLSKLLLLKGYSDLAGQLRQYSSRVVTIPDLFRTSKIPASFSAVAAKEAKDAKEKEKEAKVKEKEQDTGKDKEKEKEKPKAAVPGAPPGKKAAPSNPTPEGAATKAKAIKAATFAKLDAIAGSATISPKAVPVKKGKDDKGGKSNKKVIVDEYDSSIANDSDVGDDDGDKDDTQEVMSEGTTDILEWSSVWTTVPKGKHKAASGASANASPHVNKGTKIKDGFKKDKKEYFKDKVVRRKGWAVRELDPRPCHTYYLSDRGCRNGEDCGYAHHYDLSDDEVEELRRLAKEMVCPYARNNKCHFSDDECVYGHQCPRMEDCKFGDTCRFRHLDNGHGELE